MARETEQREYIKVLLVGVDTGAEQDFEHSMEELASLAEADYRQVAGIVVQRMEAVNKSLYIGTGKVAEVKEYAARTEAEEVIFDNALSPTQIRNLGKELELPILDRNNLILDIFALRARTGEAKLQVEAARLQYMLPRLVGMRDNLSRQGGTGGSMSNKGAGETKLELDRRRIERRISELKRELDEMEKHRGTMRKKRERSRVPQAALVGYTNAGKSTILNRLVESCGESREKTVEEKDMLFATLDTAVRSINAGDNRPFFLADTVGFIHRLPHGLVQAFHSTLEEVKYADLLIQVVDFSDEHYRQQMEVTEQTLKELGAGGIPMITVYNKADKCGMTDIPQRKGSRIYMAAGKGNGLEELREMIQERLYADCVEAEFLLPFDSGDVASFFMENAAVLEREYTEAGVRLKVSCRSQDAERYMAYALAPQGPLQEKEHKTDRAVDCK